MERCAKLNSPVATRASLSTSRETIAGGPRRANSVKWYYRIARHDQRTQSNEQRVRRNTRRVLPLEGVAVVVVESFFSVPSIAVVSSHRCWSTSGKERGG